GRRLHRPARRKDADFREASRAARRGGRLLRHWPPRSAPPPFFPAIRRPDFDSRRASRDGTRHTLSWLLPFPPAGSVEQDGLEARFAGVLRVLGAIHAVARIGHGLETALADFTAAALAFAEGASFQAIEGGGDFRSNLPGVLQQAGTQLLLEGI